MGPEKFVFTVDRQLDTPLETLSSWGKKRKEITSENAGERIHLRVEVQKLFGFLLQTAFCSAFIHTYSPSIGFMKNPNGCVAFIRFSMTCRKM